jgi:hypothetical protein
MDNSVKHKIIPQRILMMRRFSLAAMVIYISVPLLSVIGAVVLYSQPASNFEYMDNVVSIVSIIIGFIVITSLVFILRGLSNIANFIKTKYGPKYAEINFPGAAYWLTTWPWLAILLVYGDITGTIGGVWVTNAVGLIAGLGLFLFPFLFMVAQIVSSKKKDDTFFSKHRGLVKYGFGALSTALIITIATEKIEDEASFIFLWLIMLTLFITAFYLIQRYAALLLKDIELMPNNYTTEQHLISNQVTKVDKYSSLEEVNDNKINIHESTYDSSTNRVEAADFSVQIDDSIQKIEKLNEIKESGLITEEEYKELRRRELGL